MSYTQLSTTSSNIRAILANLQANSYTENTPTAIKHFVPMATHSFPISIRVISLRK